jgi:hypothetical protein
MAAAHNSDVDYHLSIATTAAHLSNYSQPNRTLVLVSVKASFTIGRRPLRSSDRTSAFSSRSTFPLSPQQRQRAAEWGQQ